MDFRQGSDGNRRISAPGADDQNDLIARLENLSVRAERIVSANDATAAQMQQISGYVVEIRRLLAELRRLQAGGAGSSVLTPASCEALADRYFALEGMMKELRNDIIRR